MILNWLDATKATQTGILLADKLTSRVATSPTAESKAQTPIAALEELLRGQDLPAENLNFYKRAKLANSFKWRLLENGLGRAMADEATQTLLLNMSTKRGGGGQHPSMSDEKSRNLGSGSIKQLIAQGNKCMARRAYSEAIAIFRDLLARDPSNAVAYNNLGAALSGLSRFQEAEAYFRSATEIRPDFVEAHSNLGMVLRSRGYLHDSENSLRRALKLNPSRIDARIHLGMTLALMNRFREAAGHFRKVLKVEPRNADALFGMGQIASMEGRFEEASKILKQALQVSPTMPVAWAALSGLRRMTASDESWLQGVDKIVAAGVPPMEDATLHFAMGKYYDDLGEYEQAFKKFQHANELLRPLTGGYDRAARTVYVDNLIRAQASGAIAAASGGTSDSTRPIFVVGMMRSGTSLTEQILASHPLVHGAGELEYWRTVMREHGAALEHGLNPFNESVKRRVADGYLRTLEKISSTAARVTDKAPLNSDYLGIIHSIFPNARIIYMQRDPVDTCLSCYFQNFSLAQNFTVDLSDLAHYYREHHRLVSHWRSVLPHGTILNVRYEELVADQEGWTRKMLEFVELEWDARCLDFQATDRPIVTASYWQARQKIFKTSVNRWRSYEKFIAPLRALDSLRV